MPRLSYRELGPHIGQSYCKCESCALPWLWSHVNISIKPCTKLLRDHKTKAHPLLVDMISFLELPKDLEKISLIFLWNSDSSVYYVEFQDFWYLIVCLDSWQIWIFCDENSLLILLLFLDQWLLNQELLFDKADIHCDWTLVSELDWVWHQVNQNLLNPLPIWENFNCLRKVNLTEELDLSPLCLKATHGYGFCYEVMYWEPSVVDFEPIELDFRVIKNIFDKAHKEENTILLYVKLLS
jgi:hypothetical protein